MVSAGKPDPSSRRSGLGGETYDCRNTAVKSIAVIDWRAREHQDPLMRRASLIFSVLFLISAVLQWNDPDPWRWAAIYLAAAAVSGWAWRTRVPRWAPFLVAAVTLAWAAVLAPAAFADFRFSDLAREMKAGTPAIELSREWLGLILIEAWMIAVGLGRAAHKKTARDVPGRS